MQFRRRVRLVIPCGGISQTLSWSKKNNLEQCNRLAVIARYAPAAKTAVVSAAKGQLQHQLQHLTHEYSRGPLGAAAATDAKVWHDGIQMSDAVANADIRDVFAAYTAL